MIDHHSYTHTLSSCEIKAWKKIRPEWDSFTLFTRKMIKFHKPCKMTAVSNKADGVWGDFSGAAKAQIATTVTPSR